MIKCKQICRLISLQLLRGRVYLPWRRGGVIRNMKLRRFF
jgi:hypothetical protein